MPVQIPIGPVSLLTKLSFQKSNIKTVFYKNTCLNLTSARAGIALAIKQLKISAGDKILVPAFHCTAMIEPLVWQGIIPVFYKIKNDCSIDFEDLSAKLDQYTKAIIAVHYFGFPQDVKKICEFCNQNKIFFIEDCAHAFWGETNGFCLGESSDWAVASAMKFFPVMEGGFLYSSKHRFCGQTLTAVPVLTNFKTIVNSFERAFAFGRMKLLSIVFKQALYLKEAVWNTVKKKSGFRGQAYYLPAASHGGYSFEPYWMDKKMSLVSRGVIKFSCEKEIVQKRRSNYKDLLSKINTLSGVKPVFPELPEKVVPHVLPIVVTQPLRILDEFKRRKVPFLRFGEILWQGVDESVCPVSLEYSRNGFQLPCHQDLTSKELFLIKRQLEQIFK